MLNLEVDDSQYKALADDLFFLDKEPPSSVFTDEEFAAITAS
jgi:hypothetical protein